MIFSINIVFLYSLVFFKTNFVKERYGMFSFASPTSVLMEQVGWVGPTQPKPGVIFKIGQEFNKKIKRFIYIDFQIN